jgi:hypothetical protein
LEDHHSSSVPAYCHLYSIRFPALIGLILALLHTLMLP